MLINKELFYVNHDEFILSEHREYSTLKIYPKLNILEREIGLITEIIKNCDKTTNFINIGLSHGGFVPIKLLPYFNDIVIFSTDTSHIDNLTKNCEMYDKQNKIKILNNFYEINNKFIIKNNLLIAKIDFNINNILDILDMISALDNVIILSYIEINLKNHKHYKLSNSELIIYIPHSLINLFENNFKYHLKSNILDYNNLLHLCMIVKDAGDDFKEILESNIPYIDEWTILDTGSTDNTINIINEVLKNKKGKLYEEPFINFRDSRNRCLELAGQNCKFIIMLDDTYILKGNVRSFLELIRGDQFADSYNIFVNSKDTIYGSNRLLKSDRQLKYIYKIHEIIQNDNNIVVQCPKHEIFIEDISNEYMVKRTMNRKQSDLKLLHEILDEQPNIPRTLFYITQTYCELQMWDLAFEYANKRINHPIKGYEEEITECHLIMGNIAESIYKWDWEKCEELYIKCYNHDPTRADPLYCIGNHYSTLDTNKSYKYLKQAFELGISLTSTSNLRPHIYNKLIPQMLIPICYQLNDYVLGQKAVEKYLTFNQPEETILSYSSIFKLLIKNDEYSQFDKIDTNKDILCFVADGGFKNWSGNSLNTEGVGGSETYIIEMSKHIAKLTNYKVYVFCKTNDMENSEIYENVKYKNLDKYIKFLNTHKIHTCFISRFSEYIPVTLKNNVNNLYLVVHDLSLSGNIIPLNDKLKGIFCMSEWHKEYFLNIFPMMKDITYVFPNGINIDKYNVNINKKPNSFIYSSFPNRGLLNLLKMFPKIREKIPNATLNVFCDTKNKWTQTVAGGDMILIDKLLEEQKEYVTNHGFVTKDILTNYFLQTEIWLYPCTFMETFCVTALEAAMSNTLCVTNNLGALINTVADRGIIIPGDANDVEWQYSTINKIIDILNNPSKKNDLIMKNSKWAENYDWSILAQNMIENYIGYGKKVNDNKIIKYYGPIQENIDYLCERFSHCKKVLEIGPGHVPFPLSTHFIDHKNFNNIPNLTILDITKDKLPFEDDEFDLVYCRHVLEDITNPEYVIKELVRVGKIMYFETPSPIVEVTRHIDGSSPYYRGYIHHSSIIWVNDQNELNILTKYPVIEYINVPNYYEKLGDPYFWNTYFILDKKKNKTKINVLKYDIDYNLHTEYEKMVKLSIKQSKESIKMYKSNINVRKNNIEYCGMLNWSSDIPNNSKIIFESILDRFKNTKCNILEIGTYSGTSIINMLKYLVDANATVIDMWEDYDENKLLKDITKNNIENVFYNNLLIGNVIDRVNCIKGDSKDILIKLLIDDIKYDFIYVDGSHKCLDCYTDIILSWNILNNGGVLGIDDYLWKPENSNDKLDLPYYAVNHFMERYKGCYTVLDIGYRVFLLKN